MIAMVLTGKDILWNVWQLPDLSEVADAGSATNATSTIGISKFGLQAPCLDLEPVATQR